MIHTRPPHATAAVAPHSPLADTEPPHVADGVPSGERVYAIAKGVEAFLPNAAKRRFQQVRACANASCDACDDDGMCGINHFYVTMRDDDMRVMTRARVIGGRVWVTWVACVAPSRAITFLSRAAPCDV